MVKFCEVANPFAVQTPEDISAEDAVSLFVDVFTDFSAIPREGHVFIHGPRGSGKSMMFRYLKPDCQRLDHQCDLAGLPYFSIYIPIKNSELMITEFKRLERMHADVVLNEHFMALFFAERMFDALASEVGTDKATATQEEARHFFETVLRRLLQECGCDEKFELPAGAQSASEQYAYMQSTCRKMYGAVKLYLKRMTFAKEAAPYSGPLCGYMDFLYPLLCEAKKLSFMPRGPIFLLADDADCLSLVQTQILNSWVSTRTSANVSFKISTQMQYKTYRTTARRTIDATHDFSEISIATIYTTAHKAKYRERVREIVAKRFKKYGIESAPEEFFPEDQEQEDAIRSLAAEYRKRWATEGRGYRPSDDASRYARPDFMRMLAGPRKSSHSYSYAGFDQLVHISSGIVRDFLEAAAQMFNRATGQMADSPATHIPPGIQTDEVRRQADNFLFSEFQRFRDDRAESALNKTDVDKLYNLILALGGAFRYILLSDRAERRVFSIAFSDEATAEVVKILRLGVRLGYFHVSAIGNKDGTGRTQLYILSRRLAPQFQLDPTSFAGYLFVTSDVIEAAMENPNRLLRRFKESGKQDDFFETRQLKLFD